MTFAHESEENVREVVILGKMAHEFGRNVRERALFSAHAHEKRENVRERWSKGRMTSKIGGFVVRRGVGRGEGTIFRANRLDIKNF